MGPTCCDLYLVSNWCIYFLPLGYRRWWRKSLEHFHRSRWMDIFPSSEIPSLGTGVDSLFFPFRETNSKFAPENGGFQVRNLRDSRGPPFSGAFAVSFREGNPRYLILDPTEPSGNCAIWSIPMDPSTLPPKKILRCPQTVP